MPGGPTQAPGEPLASPRPPARDSRIFQPSTFATRKAESASRPRPQGRRLVFVGTTEHRQNDIKTGRVEVVDVELYVDADNMARQFYRFPRGVIQAADVDNRVDEVTPLGVFRRDRHPRSGRADAVPEPAPRPVT